MNHTIKELLLDGLKQQVRDRQAKAKEKTGCLRAGNSGVLVSTPTGERVYGSCHRKALLRKLDIDLPAEPKVHKIFESGIGSEEANVARLRASQLLKDEGIEVRCEEEIPTSWLLSDGTPVTGRPDAVFFKDEPLAVLELKQKQTANGIQNIIDNNKPDSAHLCQAAHYSWQLGLQTKAQAPIPAFLVYSWPMLYDNLMRKDFYKSKEIWEHMELPQWKSKEPGMAKMKIYPGDKVFELFWDEEGQLCYTSENMEQPVTTVITVQSMTDFYEATNSMDKEKFLGPRPTSAHVGNKVSAGYPPCGYCDLKDTCDKYEGDFDTWLDNVKLYAEQADWTKE